MEETKWRKIEDSIFRFEKKGDFVQGVLVDVERGAIYENVVYKVKQANGQLVTIFSTTIMASKMRGVTIGDEVKIVYLGEQPSKKKGQSPLKLFDVFVR